MGKINVSVELNSILKAITSNTIPHGCHQRDQKVLENIQDLITVIDAGIDQLEEVVNTPSNGEKSIEDCKGCAKKYLNNLKEYFELEV